eukprot:1378795-Amphidinium_carterae.1
MLCHKKCQNHSFILPADKASTQPSTGYQAWQGCKYRQVALHHFAAGVAKIVFESDAWRVAALMLLHVPVGMGDWRGWRETLRGSRLHLIGEDATCLFCSQLWLHTHAFYQVVFDEKTFVASANATRKWESCMTVAEHRNAEQDSCKTLETTLQILWTLHPFKRKVAAPSQRQCGSGRCVIDGLESHIAMDGEVNRAWCLEDNIIEQHPAQVEPAALPMGPITRC